MEQHLFVFPKEQMTNMISLIFLSERIYSIIRQDLIITKARMGGDVGQPLFLARLALAIAYPQVAEGINVRHLLCPIAIDIFLSEVYGVLKKDILGQ